jgi:hypothetical protein
MPALLHIQQIFACVTHLQGLWYFGFVPIGSAFVAAAVVLPLIMIFLIQV